MTCLLEPNWEPMIRACVLIVSARGSTIKWNIVGKRGHPWRVPLDMLKGVDKRPEVFTCADGQEYRANI